jgi:hypothetical protein
MAQGPLFNTADQTVIQFNDERFWLYAAVDPGPNRLLHVRLYPIRTQALTELFLAELRRNSRPMTPFFSLPERRGSKLPVTATDSDSSMNHMGIGIASNASFVNLNDELTSSQTTSATPEQTLLDNGSKQSPSHGTSLSEHYLLQRPHRHDIWPPSLCAQGNILHSQEVLNWTIPCV